MGLFDDVIKKGIIKNLEVFDVNYFPDKIIGREKEMKTIAEAIKPLFYNSNGQNLFIYGPSGIGKTVTVKYVLKELENYDEVKPIYVNCWLNETKHTIYIEIARQLGILFPKKGISTEIILDSIVQKLDKTVFVFDEIDRVKNFDFIYPLMVGKYSFILITNKKEIILMDPRISSRLNLIHLEFEPYNIDTIREILWERVKLGLNVGRVKREAFELIVRKTYEKGDVRFGLELLKLSAQISESKEFLDVESVKEAIKLYKPQINDVLDEKEKFILKIIKTNEGKTTGEIYNLFKQKYHISLRAFRNYITKLEEKGFINFEFVEKGIKGRTRRYYLTEKGRQFGA